MGMTSIVVKRPLMFEGRRREVGEVLQVQDAEIAWQLLHSSRADLANEADRAVLGSEVKRINQRRQGIDANAARLGWRRAA